MTTSSPLTFLLPDLGEGLQDAEIVSWYVAAGDRVVADQPLVSVETDKAVVDVPAPHGGRIARVFGAPGDRIDVGDPLVEFEGEGAPPRDAGTVVGELPTDDAEPTAPAPAPATPATPATTPQSPAPAASAPATARMPGTPVGRVPAAPAVRALARRLGIELTALTPTGSRGQVTMDDVERAADAAAEDEDVRPERAAPTRERARREVPPGYEPLHGVRRAMARNMALSGAQVVPASVLDEVDIHAWPPHTDTTARLVRAIVAGCRAAPALNAWLDPDSEARRLHDRVDLGLAVEAPDGLFAPVIRDVGGLDLEAIREQVDELEAATRARRLRPEELRGATITLSNFGMLAGRYAALVIVPPQVAILGAGRAAARPVAVGDAIAVHRVLPLSLTFDHRAATGGEAAKFLSAVKADLEQAT